MPTGTKVRFQYDRNYRYKIEISTDNVNWTLVVSQTAIASAAQTRQHSFGVASGRYLKITCTGPAWYPTTWASHCESEVHGY